MTRPTHSTTVAAWNVKAGRFLAPVLGVHRIIRRYHPTVFVLMECRAVTLAGARTRTALKHRTIAPREYEWQDAALVVRRRAKLGAHGIEYVHAPWTGPDGREWPGKAIPWAVVDGVLYVGFHGPWNPHQNYPAFRAALDAVARLVNQLGLPTDVMGDINLPREELQRRMDFRVPDGRVIGTGVDLAWLRGLAPVSTTIGPKSGSDHAARIYEMERIS